MTIYTEVEQQPFILTHRCGECQFIWQERKYPRWDGSWPDVCCPMCAATNAKSKSDTASAGAAKVGA